MSASSAKSVQLFARQLLSLSLVDDLVTPERVAGVLAYLEKHPPSRPLAVLRAYHRLVTREIARSRAVVHHAGEAGPNILGAIEGAMSQKYRRPITAEARRDDALIAGLRVRVGDDVYEASVAGRLATLAAAL
jgi:F-type H+-transporting ATPase subunit delta